jgi:phage tail sheath protein FI
MPEYLHPGVYIEEIERGPRPIEGVPTSTAAFLGETERGPIQPTMVTSYKDYQRWFGNVYARDKFMPYAASGFFENGGKRVYICRIVGKDAKSAQGTFGANFSVRASGPGTWAKRIFVKIEDSKTTDQDKKPIGFRMRVYYWDVQDDPAFVPGDPTTNKTQRPATHSEVFEDLVTDERSPDFYGKRLPFIDLEKGDTKEGPDTSSLIILVRNANTPSNARPDNGSKLLTDVAGTDDPNITDVDYVGLPDGSRVDPQGLAALELDPYRDVALVYAPGATYEIAKKLIDHCELLRFRFAVVDALKSLAPGDLNPRNQLTDSEFAGFYYPWIVISDPKTGARKLVPPGGHVVGVYARTDTDRGVFKAPANEIVRGVLDLEVDINDSKQDLLNPLGVNAIRQFPGRGIRVWGARTITSNALWKYVSVRRLFIFLERSIYEGTQWVVFEPNDPRLWARVTDTIRIFLRAQWRLGALYGRTEEQAFFITCDETVMSQDDILNGRLICEIGIAPVRPAEFVVFRIFQHTAEAQR